MLSSLVVAVIIAGAVVHGNVNVTVAPGSFIIGESGPVYQSFYGIPFAEPPIGDLRFANPVRKPLWKGDFVATTPPNMCIQQNFLLPVSAVEGVEDCLYLNVYRPNRQNSSRNLLPVMVHIHGGGFFSGSIHPGIYGPDYFMETGDVILVLMQYRLSTLGFLATGDAESPGNFGLKDQVMALQWVQDHIREFGGNPNAVTIFGQSAGAASVHMHMLSPLAKNLFAKAIVMSGNALGPYNYPTRDPLALTRRHAAVLGITNADTLDTHELVSALRQMNASDLIASVAQLKVFSVDPLTIYRPVVEPRGLEGAYLTESPRCLLQQGRMEKIPLMIGVVPVEGAVRSAAIVVNATLVEEINGRMDELMPLLMELELEGIARDEFTQQIIERYLPGTGRITKENRDSFIQLYTDRSFLYPHQKSLQLMLRKPHAPIYTYQFRYQGKHSYSVLFTNTYENFGVVHCDDLLYLFRSPLLVPDDLDASDKHASDKLVEVYVRFATDSKGPWPQSKLMSDGCVEPHNVFLRHTDTQQFGSQLSNDWDADMMEFWDGAKEFST